MNELLVSTTTWFICYNHAYRQSLNGSNIHYSPTKTRQFLAEQYGIVHWVVIRGEVDKVKLTFVDDKKIMWFTLRWV